MKPVSTPSLEWKIGFEIELMAPPGASRLTLADATAKRLSGRVRPFFHPQVEPSAVSGQPTFENLTKAFEAVDRHGDRIAAFVDDLTLQAGLDRGRAPLPGWWRVVSDDARLLGLAMRHCDPSAPLPTLLAPLAALFGAQAEAHPGGMVRVMDSLGRSIAIGAPLPGERERPCEIVTAPIITDHLRVLQALLEDARALGFTAPLESAVHLHFDAEALCQARIVARLIAVLHAHRDALREAVKTNPHCVRLGPIPDDVRALAASASFQALPWPEARAALAALKPSKYVDFNLANLAQGRADKHTFEVRILPGSLSAEAIIDAAALFERILRWAIAPGAAGASPPDLDAFLYMHPRDEIPAADKNRLSG